MHQRLQSTWWQVGLLGAAAGLRTLTPAATMAARLSRRSRQKPTGRLRIRSQGRLRIPPQLAAFLALAAIGELVVDKLPSIPPRTTPASLLGRVGSGAFLGALLCLTRHANLIAGAALGGTAAAAASFAGYHSRRLLTTKLPLRDTGVALVEDLLAGSLAFLGSR